MHQDPSMESSIIYLIEKRTLKMEFLKKWADKMEIEIIQCLGILKQPRT